MGPMGRAEKLDGSAGGALARTAGACRAGTGRRRAVLTQCARQVRVDTSLFTLMRQFEKGRSHMALVVDAVRPSYSVDTHTGVTGWWGTRLGERM